MERLAIEYGLTDETRLAQRHGISNTEKFASDHVEQASSESTQ